MIVFNEIIMCILIDNFRTYANNFAPVNIYILHHIRGKSGILFGVHRGVDGLTDSGAS